MTQQENQQTVHALSLRDIAAWQIDELLAPHEKTIMADLPALQRGAVWKVQQIEELWDSVLRGFPIGAFILSPPNAALLRQDFKLQKASADPARRKHSHLLLDGQQRATAIALAFDDIWQRQDEGAKAALWVDLGPPPSERQVAYAFRVVTRAHPWGYRLSNPQDILSVSAIRAALAAWQAAHQFPDKRPDEFALWATWPWDCAAPVPVALLIAELEANPHDLEAARAAVWQRLQKLPLFSFSAVGRQSDDIQSLPEQRHTRGQQDMLRAAFTNAAAPEYQRLGQLLRRLHDVLQGPSAYEVPALLLQLTSLDRASGIATQGQQSSTQAKDAIELLFIRINSAGTPLVGEELSYSLIKAEWPEVAQWMQTLPKKPAQASRIAALCIRLGLARTSYLEGNAQATLPAMPSMPELRRMLNNDDFSIPLKAFIFTDATGLFETAWRFLTEARFALLPTQAVDMAQHAPDVYLLLLRWIDRLASKGLNPKDLTEAQHRRTLGFLSALAWFASDKNRACAAIWPGLEAEMTVDHLKDYFNAKCFRLACQLSDRGALRMIPLPSPDELASVCERFMENDGRTTYAKEKATVHFPKGSFWNDGDWWYSQFVPALTHRLRETWKEPLNGSFQGALGAHQERDALDDAALAQQIASHFLDTLWNAKPSVLLYAQREPIRAWFPQFDPSLPEMMEDRNRPWDWDHLLAQSFFSSRWGIPQSVKDWGNSIGNLRAWPLEANRSDGAADPKTKLDGQPSAEEKRYGIGHGPLKRKASFVGALDWTDWQLATPTNEAGDVSNTGYLSNNADPSVQSHRIHAVTAMINRFVALYRHWHKELKLSDFA